uniref:claudin-10-like n=1 Tax=Monopterus albus TaxID=43700 RepID=UPI0009B4DDE5|nr:claudin-10-like [Monopterus albus]
MEYRMTVMYIEIVCFMSCLCGWILVCSTIPTDFWMVSEDSGNVMTASNFYSNLWKECVVDSTGATACKDYTSMMALSVYLHVCRALTVCSVITGFFGGVLTLIGMKCTKIGGSETASARVTFAAGITYLVSAFCGMITYTWWANRSISDFLNPAYLQLKYELGAAIFIGWGGSFLLLFGGMVLSYFSGKECFQSSSLKRPLRPFTYATAQTRRTYMMPPSSSRATLMPPLLYEGRRSRAAGGTTRTGHLCKECFFFDM